MKLMGETLRQYRAHKNIFPKRSYDTQTLKRIFRHLLLGLDYVHSSGYIHTGKLKAILYKHFVLKYLLTRAAVQDLQPSNLFVDVQSGEEIEEFLTRAPPMDLFSRLRRGSVMPTTRWLSSEDYKNIHVRIADFSEAVRIDTMNKATYVQPFRLRAPEVFLGLGWTEKIDIWNLGCILWELSQGRHLFDARNVKTKEYDWRVHFHEIEAQLGLPPQKYIDAFNKKKGWFVPKPRYGAPFEELEGMLQGDDQQKFFSFMRAMLQWLPKDRVSAKELLQHEWLNSDST
ncbi:hypothetical protein MMC09_001376 [Bachmanniomyces sp. S44760]|nr:hypothetical protein [Bachmanniomyces sp. S44760]